MDVEKNKLKQIILSSNEREDNKLNDKSECLIKRKIKTNLLIKMKEY